MKAKLFLAFLVGLLALANCVSREDGQEQRRRDGRDALQSPQSVAGWIRLSEEYLRQCHDVDDVTLSAVAESAAREAFGRDSTVAALIQLAKVRTAQRQFDDVVALLSDAVRGSPYEAEAWGVMGDAFLHTGRYRSADSCYHAMYDLDQGFASLRRMAMQKTLSGEFETAIEYLDRALAEQRWGGVPERELAATYAQLADLFLSHGYVDAALENIERSLGLQPNAVPYLAKRADMLRIKTRFVEAEQIYERLTSLSPHPFYKSTLARFYAHRGAQVVVDSLVRLSLDSYEQLSSEHYDMIAPRYIEFLLEWDVDPPRALKLAREQTSEHPDIYGYERLARAYHKNGQYELAWSSIALALRKAGKHPRLVYTASVIAKVANKPEKYEVFKERSQQVNPMAADIFGPW